jgi:hypothetical protein
MRSANRAARRKFHSKAGRFPGEWQYNQPECPCCRSRPVTLAPEPGAKVWINAWIDRCHDVLIVYPLCEQCGPDVFQEATTDGGPLHRLIEQNLAVAYEGSRLQSN